MPRIPASPYRLALISAFAAAVACASGDSLTIPSEGLPAHITLMSGEGQDGTVAAPLAEPLVVRITDSKDRPVQNQPVAFAMTAGGAGGLLIPDTATTDADGQARAQWQLGQIAGPQKVRARVVAHGYSGTLSTEFTATAAAEAADTVFALSGDAQTAVVNTALSDPLVVEVTDEYGNPVAGQDVTWTVPAGQGSVSASMVTTGSDGQAGVTRTLGPGSGTQTTTATIAGLKGSPVLFTSTAAAGGAARLVKAYGDGQTAPAGQQLTDSIVVQVQDGSGNGVPGRSVNWVVTGGGGSTSSGSSLTDANGRAFVDWTLGTTAGPNTVTAAVTGLPQVTFTATGTASQPTRIAAQSSTTLTGTAGLAVTPVPSARVTDQNNNPVQGVTVTFAVTVGGGSVSDGQGTGAQVTVATNASGIATLTTWTLGTVAGANSLTASASGPGGALTGSPVLFTATGAVGPAAQLAMVTQPSANASSGVVLATQPAVRLQDQFGNNVNTAGVGVTVSVSGTGTLSGVTTVNTVAGVATFSGLAITGPVGGYTLSFAATNLTGVTSNTITLGAGVQTRLAITTQPSATAQNGVPLAIQPVIQLRDNANNNVALAGIPVTATVSTGGTLTGTATVNTAANGQAVFTGLAISGVTGSYTLTFTSGVLTSVISNSIALGASAATKLVMTTQPSNTALSGVALVTQPVVQLQDVGSNNVATPGVNVTAAVSVGGTLTGTATVATNANGQAVFTNLVISGLVGNYTLTFSGTGLTAATSNTMALAAGPATQLAILTQPSAAASSGVALAQQPVIQLRDNAGNNVASGGLPVAVTVSTGGTLGGTTPVLTTANGQATFSGLSVSGAAGSYTLTFTSTGLTSVTSTAITLGAGTATQLSITTQPSAAAASGTAFAVQPAIQLRDAANNPVATANVTITVAIGSGTGGTLGGILTANTNAAGLATFAGLSITGPVGNFTLTFTSGALTPVTSTTIVLGAGAANHLSITTQPSATASSGVAFGTQPVLQLRDAANNAVSQTGVVVTASILTGTGATLGGTLTATTNATGAATFTNLALTGTPGSFTLNFSDGGTVTAIGSNPIILSAGTATRLSITTQPSPAATNNAAFPTQPVIQLLDAQSNPVSQAGVIVTAAIGTGTGATLGGTLTATTNASGVASFTNLMLTGTVGNFSLTFTAPALTAVTSNSIALSAGVATQLTITVQPPASAQSGVAFAVAPVLQLRDVSSNPVTTANQAVTAAIATGTGGSLTNAIALTDGTGAATFTGLTLSGTSGNFTLRFSSGSVTPVVSSTVALGAGAGSNLSITTQPSATATSGVAFAQQPAIQLRDASNNPVNQAGISISAGFATGSGTLGGASATTNASGLATFTNLSITGLASSYTLIFSAPSYTSVVSNTITLSAGVAALMTINTQPDNAIQSGVAFSPVPVVTVTDGGGNLLSSQSVAISVASGGALTFTNGTATTGANGQATFTGLVGSGLIGSRTLRFSSGAATAVSSAVSLSAGPAALMAMATQPSATVQSGVVFPTVPVVTVTDDGGNPVTQSVAVTVASGGGLSFTNGTASTNGAGQATFTGLIATGAPGARTLLFTGGAATATSNTVTVSASPTSTAVASSLNPSSFGTAVSFTATVTSVAGTPTGSVQFLVDGANLGTAVALNGSGVATSISTSTLTAGNHAVTANFLGSTNFAASTGTLSGGQNVSTAPTATAVASSANPSTFGQSVSFTATVTDGAGGTPSGSVQFLVDGGNLGTAVALNGSGVATSTSTSALAVGNHTVTANFLGSTNFAASSGSLAGGQTANQASTTTAVGSTANPSAFGQSVSFTATVSSGGGTPGGTVQFVVDGSNFGGPVTLAGGIANSSSTAALAVGTHTVAANYSGATSFVSSSGSLTGGQVVGAAGTTTGLTSSANPSGFGQSVTFTATVTGSGGTPTGSVSFRDGVTVIGSGALSGGVATFTTTTLSTASHGITAVYGGDASFSGSTSNLVSQTVNPDPTSTAVASSANPSTFGQSVSFTATVTDGTGGTPTGNVQFLVDGSLLGTVALNGSGVATSPSTSTLTVATHTVTANFQGSTNFQASSGSLAGGQVVNQTTSTTGLATSGTPSTFGQSVTFTATVTGAGTTPTGTVQFRDGVTTIGSGTLSAGVATLNTSALSSATHSMTAVYLGDAGHSGSTSSTVNQVVNPAGSSTALGSSANPSTFGQSVTFTATVSGAGATPTGTVTFSDGVTSIGSSSLSGGVATLTTSALGGGSHGISASYGGDANHNGSTSSTLTQNVNAAATTTDLTSPTSATAGTPFTVSVVVSSTAGTPTGTVTVGDGSDSCVITLVGGGGSCDLTLNTPGTSTVTADYAGDGDFAASSSTPIDIAVQ